MNYFYVYVFGIDTMYSSGFAPRTYVVSIVSQEALRICSCCERSGWFGSSAEVSVQRSGCSW